MQNLSSHTRFRQQGRFSACYRLHQPPRSSLVRRQSVVRAASPIALAATLLWILTPPPAGAAFQAQDQQAAQDESASSDSHYAPMLDEEFDLDAELEALIAELDPPPLEEVLEWFEPIPTVEEALAPLPDDPNAPYLRSLPSSEQQLVDELSARIEELCEAARFDDALPLARQELEIRESHQGTNHWATINVRNGLNMLESIAVLSLEDQIELASAYELEVEAMTFFKQKFFREALPLLERALQLRLQYLELEQPVVVQSMENFAFLLQKCGKLEEADLLTRLALRIRIQLCGTSHPDVALTLSNAGGLLCETGKCSAGVDCSTAAVLMFRRLQGDGCPPLDDELWDFGNVLVSYGDMRAAERVFTLLLKRRESRFGVDSRALTGVLNHLAGAVRNQGDYERAESLFRRALEIELQRSEESLNMAVTLQNLGLICKSQGRLGEAERAVRDSLRIQRLHLGNDHPIIGHTLVSLAGILNDRGAALESETLLRQAISMHSGYSGPKSHALARTLRALSSTLLSQGRLEDAHEVCRSALRMRQDLHGDASEADVLALRDLAAIQRRQNKPSEAIQAAREAHRICRRWGTASPGLRMTVMTEFGRCLSLSRDQNEREEADGILADAVRLARQYGVHNPEIPCIVYADFQYRIRSSPADAAVLYAEAVDHIQRFRVNVAGDELDRARCFDVWREEDAFGGLLRAQLSLASHEPQSSDCPVACGPNPAFDTLERGRGRALLDLLGRSRAYRYVMAEILASNPEQEHLRSKLETIRKQEIDACSIRLTTEAQISAAEQDTYLSDDRKASRIAELRERRAEAQNVEQRAIREMADLICLLSGARELLPMTTKQIAAELQPGDHLLAYDVGDVDAVLFSLNASEDACNEVVKRPDGAVVAADSLVAMINRINTVSSEKGGAPLHCASAQNPRELERLSQVLLPQTWKKELAHADRVFIVPDGPLHELPFEMLVWNEQTGELWIDVGPPIVYGPSGTVIMTKRKWAQERKAARAGDEQAVALIALGDPVFSRAPEIEAETPDAPAHGVLLAAVTPDGNAQVNGLRAGDVLLGYDGLKLGEPADLGPAIKAAETRRRADVEAPQESEPIDVGATNSEGQGAASQPAFDRVPITVWRDGATLELTLEPGRMGVRPSQCCMPTALYDWRELRLSEDERCIKYASATTRDGFGDTLKALPGTRVEVDALADVMKRAGVKSEGVKVLAGEDATLTKLFEAVESPRFLHLATHGKVESGRRVHESALALTVPRNPTPDDYGFLRLQDLLYKWGGKLEGTELVVLSGCATATGRLEAADGFVGLTWGFLFAGADSVIASLWKVDDAATALLMRRLYENLLGVHEETRMGFDPGTPLPKAEALHEAKRWLRNQTPEQNRRMLAELGMDMESLHERHRRERGWAPSDDPQPLPDPFDYSAPHYWAAFVLIGSPD